MRVHKLHEKKVLAEHDFVMLVGDIVERFAEEEEDVQKDELRSKYADAGRNSITNRPARPGRHGSVETVGVPRNSIKRSSAFDGRTSDRTSSVLEKQRSRTGSTSLADGPLRAGAYETVDAAYRRVVTRTRSIQMVDTSVPQASSLAPGELYRYRSGSDASVMSLEDERLDLEDELAPSLETALRQRRISGDDAAASGGLGGGMPGGQAPIEVIPDGSQRVLSLDHFLATGRTGFTPRRQAGDRMADEPAPSVAAAGALSSAPGPAATAAVGSPAAVAKQEQQEGAAVNGGGGAAVVNGAAGGANGLSAAAGAGKANGTTACTPVAAGCANSLPAPAHPPAPKVVHSKPLQLPPVGMPTTPGVPYVRQPSHRADTDSQRARQVALFLNS